jgi:hypothetical protein
MRTMPTRLAGWRIGQRLALLIVVAISTIPLRLLQELISETDFLSRFNMARRH